MNRIRMAPGVEFLEMPKLESWQIVNGVYITGRESILIDGRMEGDKSLRFIRENKINRYFISHFHVDHAAGAWRVAAETDCRPALNDTEFRYLHSRENYAAATGYASSPLLELAEEALMPKIGLRYMPDLASYSNGEIEDITDGRLRVIPAPGHSPGHYCLYAPDTESLFAGDLGLDLFGPWYGFPHCSISGFLESIEKIRGLPVKRLFSSHGPMIRQAPDQALARSRETIEARHAQIMDAWDAGERTVKEIAARGIFYKRVDGLGRRLIPLVCHWQETMVTRHLEYAGLIGEVRNH